MWKMEAAIYPNQENGGMYHTVIVVHNSKKWWELYYDRDGWSKLDLQPLASGLHFAIPCCTQHSGSVLFQNSNSPLSMQIYAKIVGSLCLYMHICIYIHKLWYNWYEIQLLCYNPVCKITLQKKKTL